MVEIDVMEEHIDTAEVIGRLVNLLTIESLLHVLFADDFCHLHQQRTTSASRVIDLTHFLLAIRSDTRQQFAYFLRREILTTALACIACVHLHQELIRIAERINLIILRTTKVHVSHSIQDLHQPLITFGNRRTEFGRVDIKVIKQTLHIILAVCSDSRSLDGLERSRKRHI